MAKKQRMNLADLEPSPTTPDPVVQSIAAPEAKRRGTKKKRSRDWDKAHPPRTYKIPVDFHARALAVREAIKGIAESYNATADDVATALMTAALTAVQEGEIRLDFRPNPRSRKMTVEVVREGGWPQQELPKPKPRKKTKRFVLNYRWSKETHQRIIAVAQDAPIGAVVILLLEAALERVKAGKWGFRPRPVTSQQTVTVAHSWKIKR